MNDPIDISASQRKALLDLIQRYLPNVEVWAFGSRVKWTARSNSDLDLVAFSKPEDEERVSWLKEALEESSLPFRVDFLVWDNIPECFQKNIEGQYAVLVDGKNAGQGWGGNNHTEFELQDIAELKGGFAFKSEDYTDDGMFVLRTVNVTDSGRITRDGATFVSEEKAKEFDRFALKHHDTLFVMVGSTLGKVGLVKDTDLPALLNQNMWVIRADSSKVNPLYLYYAFSEESKKMLKWASGAARDFVRRDDYRKLKIPLPSRLEQDKISGFIGLIDDKIDLNRRINQTLEAMAQSLFKSWFVDFDPVKAKIAAKQAWLAARLPSPFGRGVGGEGVSAKPRLPEAILAFARQNRRNTTDAESLMWQLLRNRHLGCKFRRQHPMPPYILDFYCQEHRLVIEIDGGQHYTSEGLASDAKRTDMLNQHGISVMRFSNREVLLETEAVLEQVWRATLTPTPLPVGEGLEEVMLRAAMCAISSKSDTELDALPAEHYEQLAATAALFPDEMEESALGEIPRGWSTKKFGDFIDRISVGKKFDQKTALAEGSVPILDQGKSGVIGFHNDPPGVCASMEKPVVVFANHTCHMRLITFNFSAIQNVLPFIGKGVDTVWAYYATKDAVKFSEYKGHWPDFVLADTAVPQPDLTVDFRKILQPLILKMRILELESEKLTTLRDTLLPKLLSGELSVENLSPEPEATA